ncbi:MAG: hypothetical protein [Bacteriophage sp.]|jgi:hypothetical protein|nr:MAG: hypothetical protein [Bacteriophage sp.]UVX68518.1 MAG: hypothetical protein [Bacteriophage sp.]DAP34002.1 MAG TPA: hypothetical protein [Caudoviricetes sp.]
MGEMTNRTYNAGVGTVDAFMQLEPTQMQQFHS